jgi:hypothetical protein
MQTSPEKTMYITHTRSPYLLKDDPEQMSSDNLSEIIDINKSDSKSPYKSLSKELQQIKLRMLITKDNMNQKRGKASKFG